MGNYDQTISRTDATALVPEDVASEILKNVPQRSAVMTLGRKVQTMPRAQRRMPVLSALPTAYFVNGDTGLKKTTKLAWDNKYLDAEEIACIVPVPEAVLDDVGYDIWGEVRPAIEEEFGRVFDAAVFHGTNAPSSWPTNIVDAAAAAANAVALGSVGVDLYDDIMDEGGVIAKVEADGYLPNGHVGALSLRGKLRGLRDANGLPIFKTERMQGRTDYSLDGDPIFFPRNGAFDATDALMIAGDWSQLVWTYRQDMTWKILTEAVITDETGAIVYNLAQQDMVALRCVMRIAWQVPNPINRVQETEASRYPFATLTP